MIIRRELHGCCLDLERGAGGVQKPDPEPLIERSVVGLGSARGAGSRRRPCLRRRLGDSKGHGGSKIRGLAALAPPLSKQCF